MACQQLPQLNICMSTISISCQQQLDQVWHSDTDIINQCQLSKESRESREYSRDKF